MFYLAETTRPPLSPRHGATLELAICGLRLADQNVENGSSSTVRYFCIQPRATHCGRLLLLIFVRQSRFAPETVEASAGGRSSGSVMGQEIVVEKDGKSIRLALTQRRRSTFRNCYSTSYISSLNIYCSHNNIWRYDRLLISTPWSNESPPKSLSFCLIGHLTAVIVDYARVAQNGVSRTLLCLSFQGGEISGNHLLFTVRT